MKLITSPPNITRNTRPTISANIIDTLSFDFLLDWITNAVLFVKLFSFLLSWLFCGVILLVWCELSRLSLLQVFLPIILELLINSKSFFACSWSCSAAFFSHINAISIFCSTLSPIRYIMPNWYWASALPSIASDNTLFKRDSLVINSSFSWSFTLFLFSFSKQFFIITPALLFIISGSLPSCDFAAFLHLLISNVSWCSFLILFPNFSNASNTTTNGTMNRVNSNGIDVSLKNAPIKIPVNRPTKADIAINKIISIT